MKLTDSITDFIRTNREDLEEAIVPVISGKKPTHHLKY